MPTLLQLELTVNDDVTQALDRIRRQALAQYPREAGRITRGHAIAVRGGVHLDGHGLAAVQSQRQPETWYTVNGHCACQDASRAPAGRCKHRWAKALMVQALTHLAQHSDLPSRGATDTVCLPALDEIRGDVSRARKPWRAGQWHRRTPRTRALRLLADRQAHMLALRLS